MTSYRGLTLCWLLGLTLLHLWMIASGRWALSADEAHYWEWSRRLDWSYYSKGPMVAYLIALSTRVGGNAEFWIRLPAVLLGTATAGLAYCLTRRSFPSERAAFLCVIILSVMPLYAVGSLLMTIDPPFVFFWGLACLCLSQVPQRRGNLAWYGAGIAFGLGLLSKYTMLMLLPCVVLWLANSPRLRHWFGRREPYEALILGLLIFSPVILWNARHEWLSLHHVATQAAGTRPLLAALLGGPEFLGGQVGVVSPLLFLLLVLGVSWAWREGVRQERDDLLLLVYTSAPVFLFFQVWSFCSKVQANWAAHAYFTAAVAAAGWATRWPAGALWQRARHRLNRFLTAAILLPILALPVVFAPSLVEVVGFRLPAALDLVGKRLAGWPELGRAVGEVMEKAPRSAFLASDRYQIASQLAFYVPGNPVAYTANFGRRMNQYDLWGGWEDLLGKDGVFVLYGTGEPPDELRRAFRSVERVRAVPIASHGRHVHEFSVFLGQGFRGFPPRPFDGF